MKEQKSKKLNTQINSEERFRAIIDQTTAGIAEVDLSGRFILVNDRYCEIVSYSREELLSGLRMQDITHPDDLPPNLVLYQKMINEGTPFVLEKRYLRKDGSIVFVSNSVSLVRADQGKPSSVIAVTVDITERKQAEEALRLAHQQTTHILESITDCFFALDSQWRFTYVNPQTEAYFGIPKEQFLGRSFLEVLPQLRGHDILQRHQEAMSEQKTIRFESESPVTGRWVEVNSFPSHNGLTVYFRDITERKQAEAALHLSEEKYRLLWATAGDAFVLFDANNMIHEANAAVETIFGYAPEEVIGQDIAMLQPEWLREGHRRGLRRYLETGSRTLNWRAVEVLGLHRDGRQIPVEIAFNHLHLEGKDLFAGFIRDITGRRQAEAEREELLTREKEAHQEAEAANRIKDEFLATLSHELRTPLTAIIGWSRMLSDGRLGEEEKARALQTIHRNAQLQAQLVEDILDVSRIITGKLRLEVAPVDLSSVIESAVESVLPAAEAKGIRLQRVLDSGTSLVAGDPGRLQQVIWNLLTNAVKFTPKGGRVQVRLERINSHVEVIVTDTGAGIAPEALPHVFERFRQADQSSTRNHGGLGLGLAIVRHIVEAHGGSVDADSPGEGGGATFTVKLPLIATRFKETAPDKAEERVHPTATNDANNGGIPFSCPDELQGLHVLVVDDDEDSRHLVRTVLESCEAQVTTAANAAEALLALQSLRPDVLVSDLGMPGEDGYSLIRKVRALSPEQGGHIPAAALTAYARVNDRLKVLRSGFQIHLPKPVEPDELVAVVANLAKRIRD